MPEQFNFSVALQKMREDGITVTRIGWNGQNQYIGVQVPSRESKNTLPYLFFVTPDGERVPWVASQTDLLAGDWTVR